MQSNAAPAELLPDIFLKNISVLSLIDKHEYRRSIEFLKKFCKSSLSRALTSMHEFNSLFDLLLGATKVSNLHIRGMLEIFPSQLLYRGLHGCRKHHERAIKALSSNHGFLLLLQLLIIVALLQRFRHGSYNIIHGLLKVHLYHLIRLIQYAEEALVEHKKPLAETIFNPTWSSDDDFDASANQSTLLLGAFASHDNH
jgi:hypothetical protein